MNPYEEFYPMIVRDIGQRRFEHSVRTAECARVLAERWGADVEKAFTAGIFHDCGKIQDRTEQRKEAMKYEELSDYWGEKSFSVLHAKLGVIFARERYGITDDDILNAISYHTTGRAEMSILEKVIFVSDCMEPGRTFDGVESIRLAARRNIDEAVCLICSRTITQLSRELRFIECRTFEAYNYYLRKR